MRFFCLICFCLLTACQTRPARQFEKLKTGMEKADVLYLMGGPQRTQRWQGMDRWTYIYYLNLSREEREVHFAEGKVVYLGPKQEPPVSATEQDRLLETQNAELEKEWAAQREENKNNLPLLEQEADGKDEIRYSPQFEPVQ